MSRGDIYELGDRDPLPVLKWLRQQGERGVDWEFSGAGKRVSFKFMNDKLELAYIMVYDWTKPE